MFLSLGHTSIYTQLHINFCFKQSRYKFIGNNRRKDLFFIYYKTTRKINSIAGMDRPRGFQEVEVPRFQDNRHMKVVRLSALRIGRLYPSGNIPGTHFCQRLSRTQGHSEAERIMLMKNSNDTTGNRIRDLPACSAVPQLTAPPRAPTIRTLRSLSHIISRILNTKLHFI